MDIIQEINKKIQDTAMNSRVYPKYLYLGGSELHQLRDAVFRNICFIGKLPGWGKDDNGRAEYRGLLVFEVDADNHLNVA